LRKILIMVEDGFDEAEFLYPYYRVQEAGYKAEIVGPKAGEIYTGKYGVPVKSELSPQEVSLEEYDGVIIPGGRAPDRMRINKGLVDIVKNAYGKGKVIAAICHGPQMLIEADIIRGKKATCWKSVITDLKNAGAEFADASVMVDGVIVTSRFPGDLPRFCQELLRLLKK
jgi:protease I